MRQHKVLAYLRLQSAQLPVGNSNSFPCHHSYKSCSGMSSINTITMGGIRDEEKLIASQIALVSQLVISSALDIAEKMFECFPVTGSGPGLELKHAR